MQYLTGKADHLHTAELSRHVAALLAEVQQRGLEMQPCQHPDVLYTHTDSSSAVAAVHQQGGYVDNIACDVQQCTACGDGLTCASVGQAAQFTITSKDWQGQQCTRGGMQFAVRIEGSGVQAAVSDHGDGSYGVQYTLLQEGDCRVSVMARGQHIQGSPFPKLQFGIVFTCTRSRILDAGMAATLSSMLPADRRRLTLIHDSARGKLPADFARVVTGKGRILVVVQTGSGQVVGGYVEDVFQQASRYIPGDARNFVYSLGNVHGEAVQLMHAQGDPYGVFMGISSNGFLMGLGADLAAFLPNGHVITQARTYKQPAPGYAHVQVTDRVLTGSWESPMQAAEVYHCN